MILNNFYFLFPFLLRFNNNVSSSLNRLLYIFLSLYFLSLIQFILFSLSSFNTIISSFNIGDSCPKLVISSLSWIKLSKLLSRI